VGCCRGCDSSDDFVNVLEGFSVDDSDIDGNGDGGNGGSEEGFI
jgi:hypothetical protein